MANTSYRHLRVVRSVFRAYDIRGIIGDELNQDAYYSIGKAIACRLHELKRSQIFLARDGRLTSEKLAEALTHSLLESGIDVFDLGQGSTPLMYYATHAKDIDCGLMVTGSHNPAEYNGIKMVLAGKTLANDDIQYLYALNQSLQTKEGQGHYQHVEMEADYVQRILSDVRLHRPLKVVVDSGNGMAGPIAPSLLRAMGCEVIPLYCEVDGRFPNHHPDPTVEDNLVDLKQAIEMHQADLGLAFDGDADRLGVVTNRGELIYPDRLMMMYAKDLLKRVPNGVIVYDVKCSSHLAQVIEAAGGIEKMCPTGHSLVKAVMKREGAALAGEMSGHIFFKERWYGFDDAVYSACRLLEILSQSPLNVSEQFATIPNSISTPEIKIPLNEEDKFTFMHAFQTLAQFADAKLVTIDGLRVEFADGWGLVRASNTTPCLVARFEAQDECALQRIQGLFKAQLQQLDATLDIPF